MNAAAALDIEPRRMSVPDSDFEAFVRECLSDVREGQSKLAVGMVSLRDSHERLATEVMRIVPDVEALKRNDTRQDRVLVYHGEAIDKHQRRLDKQDERLDRHDSRLNAHENRLSEVEKLPMARAPYDSTHDLSEEDDEAAERTSPGGNFRDPAKQIEHLVRRQAHAERTINRLREEREAEKERARIIDEERARVKKEADDAAKKAEEAADKAAKQRAEDRAASSRKLRNVSVVVGIIATSLTIAAHFMKLLPSAPEKPAPQSSGVLQEPKGK